MFSCGAKEKRLSQTEGAAGPKATPESGSTAGSVPNSTKQTATVSTQILLTGQAARAEAFPTTVQGESSLAANGILPWGPVQAIHTVNIGAQQWVVNELTSPDPFTHTYQLPGGTIYVSNEPLEDIVTFNGDEGPEPDRVNWTSDYNDIYEVLPGRMDVYFDQSATEADIQQLIQQNNLSVVMSWFEPPDESGMQSAIGGGGEGGPKESSATGSDSPSGSASAGTKSVSTGMIGNEIAWFDFEYDQTRFTTVGAAYAWFKTLPHLMTCCPHITDYSATCYSPGPNDPLYTQNQGQTSKWIDAYLLSTNNDVPYTPYSGRQQYIAVVDDGVYRNHNDLTRISSMGVETFDHSYRVDSIANNSLIGVPDYKMDKPRWEWPDGTDPNHYYHRLASHGTQIASLICGSSNNWAGNPSLAPGATVLPIRMKQWTKFTGFGEAPVDRPTFSINAHVKAIRALRFEFNEQKHAFDVRVVNMSWAYPLKLRKLPWPFNGYDEGFKTNISRDIKMNDRLYVAAAGNEGSNSRRYPASHENVLGVSGYWFIPGASDKYVPHPDSNWSFQDLYPVSGIYDIPFQWTDTNNNGLIEESEKSYRTNLAVTPLSHPGYSRSMASSQHTFFNGTSAATPQVAALAFHLYGLATQQAGWDSVDYHDVSQQIINTRMHEDMHTGTVWYNGPVDFHAAIGSWPY